MRHATILTLLLIATGCRIPLERLPRPVELEESKVVAYQALDFVPIGMSRAEAIAALEARGYGCLRCDTGAEPGGFIFAMHPKKDSLRLDFDGDGKLSELHGFMQPAKLGPRLPDAERRLRFP